MVPVLNQYLSLQTKHTFPFDRVIRANIGDCHASGNQVPVTYIRQVRVDLKVFDMLLLVSVLCLVRRWLYSSASDGHAGFSSRY